MDKKQDRILFIISLILLAIGGSLLIMSIISDMNVTLAVSFVMIGNLITIFRIKKK